MEGIATRTIVAALAGLVLGGACRQLNASHCGNQDGSITCEQRDAALPFCNLCVATNDGCVADPTFEPECGGLGSTGAEPITSSTTAPADSSTAAADAAESSSTGEPNLCGNGVIDEGEVCDGELLPEDAPDCSTEGYGMGPPSCQDDCSRLNYMMCPGYVEECGNEEVGAGEQCDGTVFGEGIESCDDIPNRTGDGLVCNPDCTRNTTACTFCREHDEDCAGDDDCCEPMEVCTPVLLQESRCCVPGPLGGCT